ncbi:MAG: T9SS type A sorting domain-containing protein [Bacteroidales bacterium]|jgi:PKD repeat protein|nr:T9SS type A sorting domain-containing protein [Bacteroidales bacterium]
MKNFKVFSVIFLVLFGGWVYAQNITCETSVPICTGPSYTYPAGTTGTAEPGAYYGCLATQPAPAWFHMLIEDPGPVTIYIFSTPLVDIDFICWGPFTDPHDPCLEGLTSNKIIACSYSPNPTEYCDIPTGQTGEFYILMITNYSQQPAEITFSQTAGSGSLDCSLINGLYADFSAIPIAGQAPLLVEFTDESIGEPSIWKWDFEDDGVYDSFIQNPSFTYSQTGTYSVKLWVQNETEADSAVKIDYITVNQVINCGEPITVEHMAGDIAPVTKTTVYGTVANIPGEPSKCWMTSNLGADHQASDAHDTTEASAGWYWQFNRKQGFMHDGTTRTPNSTWISYIDENSDWLQANDPCHLEIGNGWRIPTQSEWVNVNDAGGWTTWVEPWESPLKLHSGGFLEESDGTLHMRGEGGAFWSNLQGSNTTAWHERFNDTLCGYAGHYKSRGYSIRCVKNEPIVSAPEICIVSVTPDDHNQVIWEKQPSGQIASYNIYRETAQINEYAWIGSVAYEEQGVFTDMTSNPQQQPYKYKLSAVTTSGTETSLSNYHKTIHLTINEGPSAWNLIWSPYEGFIFGTYYIYRGSEPDSLELLDSISASFSSYTDLNPPLGPLYYAIEVINEEGCFPARDTDYSRSRSNIRDNGTVGMEDNPEPEFAIYPNPAGNKLYIQSEGNTGDALLVIYDMQGRVMASKSVQQGNNEISIDELSPGVYMIRLEYAQTVLIKKLMVH